MESKPQNPEFRINPEKFYTLQRVNNKSADQTAHMRMLVWSFVVPMQ